MGAMTLVGNVTGALIGFFFPVSIYFAQLINLSQNNKIECELLYNSFWKID